jgi:hypothetical protein
MRLLRVLVAEEEHVMAASGCRGESLGPHGGVGGGQPVTRVRGGRQLTGVHRWVRVSGDRCMLVGEGGGRWRCASGPGKVVADGDAPVGR